MNKGMFGYGVMLLAAAGAAIFGLAKRESYTDITKEENFKEQLYVAEIPGKLAAEDCRELERILPDCPYILDVEAQGDMEYVFHAGRQKVRIRKVWKGEGLRAGQEILLFADQWDLLPGEEPPSMELGFVNVMKEGKDYLVFADQEAIDADTGSSAYQLYGKGVVVPIFCYEPCTDIILPTNGEHTYVPYKEVKENEFFAENQEGLDALKSLKSCMLRRYPAGRENDSRFTDI